MAASISNKRDTRALPAPQRVRGFAAFSLRLSTNRFLRVTMSRVDCHQHQIATQNVCRDVTETSNPMNRIPLFEARVKLTVRCISPAATQDGTPTRRVTPKNFIEEGGGPQNHAKTHNHRSANAQNRKSAEVHNRKKLHHRHRAPPAPTKKSPRSADRSLPFFSAWNSC